MKAFLALIVLLNYLAVLLSATAGSQRIVPTAENPYVHSAGCQEHNYLKLDCFDSCNPAFTSNHHSGKNPANQVEIVVSGLDFHYSSPFFQVFYPVVFSIRNTVFSTVQPAAVGFLQPVIPPPEV